MKDFKDKVVEVKSAYDLADYIQQSGVSLKANGVGRMKGLCPFHTEKTPSFIVNESFQSYQCFGCGASGDILSFVQEYESLTFMEALTELAENRGIPINFKQEADDGVNYRALQNIVRDSALFFKKNFHNLPETHPAKTEIKERGLSLKKMVYGYAPEGRTTLYNHLSSLGYKDKDILMTGVCRQYDEGGRITDFWSGRLMFFITNITGKPIAFSARKVYENDRGGKYVNSPSSPIFNKSRALYNLSGARKEASEKESIYVTEGQFDVASFVEAGLKNAVAASGTAFTEEQALICRRLVRDTGEIIFCFDGDKSGASAARKVFESTPVIHSQSYAIPLPKGFDPCDLRLDLGNDLFRKFVKKKKIPLLTLILDQLLDEYDMESELEREAYVEESLALLRKVTSPTLRDSFLRRVAINSLTSLELLRESIGSPPEEVSLEVTSVSHGDTDDEVEKRLLKKFDEDLYNLPYRLLALMVEEPRLKGFYSSKDLLKLFPKELRGSLGVVLKYDDFVVDRFEYPVLAERIVNTNFFPFIHAMDSFEREKQFHFLVKELRLYLIEAYRFKLQSKMSDTILDGDIEALAAAIEAEESRVKTFEERI